MLTVPASCCVAPAVSMARSAVMRSIGNIAVEPRLPASADHSDFILFDGRDSLPLGRDMDRANIIKGSDKQRHDHSAHRSCHRSLVVDDDQFASISNEKARPSMAAAAQKAAGGMSDLVTHSGPDAGGVVGQNGKRSHYFLQGALRQDSTPNLRMQVMNENLPLPSKISSSIDPGEFEAEFFLRHHQFLLNYCSKTSRKLDNEDFAEKTRADVVKRYGSDAIFRSDVASSGVAGIRDIKLFWVIINANINDQWRTFYSTLPRQTTLDELEWLRLALSRDDGVLFPLVGQALSNTERRILAKLEAGKRRKVHRVPAMLETGVWVTERGKGPMTLAPSKKGSGGGETDLARLEARGFLEAVPCLNPAQEWKTVDGQPVSLRISELGRLYIAQYGTAASALWQHGESTDVARTPGEGDADDDGRDDDDPVVGERRQEDELDSDGDGHDQHQEGRDEDHLHENRDTAEDENGNEFHWLDGRTLKEVLDVAVAELGMPEISARIYLLHKLGDPPEEGPWPRWRIAAEVGLHRRQVENLENRWDDHFSDPRVKKLLKILLGDE